MIAFVLFLIVAISIPFIRYSKTKQKADSLTMEGEKDMLLKLARKQKKQAIFIALYLILVIVIYTIVVNSN